MEWDKLKNSLCDQCIHKEVCHDTRIFSDILKCRDFLNINIIKNGTWVKHEETQYMGQRYVEWTCSQCGRIGKRGWSTRSRNIDKPPLANFCPKCGADMKGEKR